MSSEQTVETAPPAPVPLIRAVGVQKHFRLNRSFWGGGKVVRAVDGVDLSVYPGEVFGLVGESGCGKSTFGRLLMRLLEPTAGSIQFEGGDIHSPLTSRRRFRQASQMVFQDPYASLNPSFRIETCLSEAFSLRGGLSRQALWAEMESLVEQVGLPGDVLSRYPHQLSGGQRQRVGIARALAAGARFLVLDEPVSALDVSIQSQILNLLIELQRKLNLTYIFISHDLGVIRYMCDRVAVMYLGKIVEVGSAREVLSRPRHPYTQGLIASVPDTAQRGIRSRPILAGDLPSPINLPDGCRFHPRCRYARPECKVREPVLDSIGEDGHQAACFYPLTAQPGLNEPEVAVHL